jgi:cell division protein FtsL
MKKNKKRKFGITRGEKLMYVLGLLAFLATFSLKVFGGATMSELEINIANIDSKIDNQKNKNESLSMQVSELTSYEKISSILSEMGLAYNNENIIIVNK